MTIQLWHQENTELDSISLKFNMLQPASALLLAPPEGYPWPPFEYQRTPDGSGVVVNVPDFGPLGTGTVTFEFLLRPSILIKPLPVGQLRLDISFSMHREGLLKLTKQEAKTTIYLELSPPVAYIEQFFSKPRG